MAPFSAQSTRASGSTVHISWAESLQGCMQICLQAGPKSPQANYFLSDRCTALRDAFDFSSLLLKPAGPEAPETGVTIAWQASPSPCVYCKAVFAAVVCLQCGRKSEDMQLQRTSEVCVNLTCVRSKKCRAFVCQDAATCLHMHLPDASPSTVRLHIIHTSKVCAPSQVLCHDTPAGMMGRLCCPSWGLGPRRHARLSSG